MNSSELVEKLHKGIVSEYYGENVAFREHDLRLSAASHIEAQDKLLVEIVQELDDALTVLEWGDITRLHERLAALCQKGTP